MIRHSRRTDLAHAHPGWRRRQQAVRRFKGSESAVRILIAVAQQGFLLAVGAVSAHYIGVIPSVTIHFGSSAADAENELLWIIVAPTLILFSRLKQAVDDFSRHSLFQSGQLFFGQWMEYFTVSIKYISASAFRHKKTAICHPQF